MCTGGTRASIIWAVICAGAAALATVLLTACGAAGMAGSGTAAAQTRRLAAFSSVDLAGSSNATVHAGGRQSVVVHADDNLLSRVTTQVRAGTLRIATTGSFTTTSPMNVQISVPSLTALALSGSGVLTAGNIRPPPGERAAVRERGRARQRNRDRPGRLPWRVR